MIRGEKEGKHIKRVQGALERFSNKCPYTEKTEHKLSQAKLEGEARIRSKARETLFAEVTISCRPLSDLKFAQATPPPVFLNQSLLALWNYTKTITVTVDTQVKTTLAQN